MVEIECSPQVSFFIGVSDFYMSALSEEERVPSPPNTPNLEPVAAGEYVEIGQLRGFNKRMQETKPRSQKLQKQEQELPQKREQPQMPEQLQKNKQGPEGQKKGQSQNQDQRQNQEQKQEEVLQEESKESISGEGECKGNQSGGEHQGPNKKAQHSSRFIQHVTTSYPILTVTYQEVNSRLPIHIPKPANIPLYEHLPSPASLPVISSIDNLLDKILTRFDHTFPLLTSPPEELIDRVAEVIDPWVAPANSWLEEYLPKPKKATRRKSSKRRRRWGRKRGSAGQPSEAGSYAEAAATSESDVTGVAGSDAEESGGKEDKDGDQELELVRTLGILMEAVEAQLENIADSKNYVMQLPSHVPVIGGWLEQQRKNVDTAGIQEEGARKEGQPQPEEIGREEKTANR